MLRTLVCWLCLPAVSMAAAAEKPKGPEAPDRPAKPVSVLLVNGDPRQEPRESETYFLEKVLSLKVQGRHDFTVLERKRLDLAEKGLPSLDVVMLCNVSSLSEAQCLDLEMFLKPGGGVLIFLGDRVDPQKYNRLLYRDGRGLLPAGLGNVIELEGSGLDYQKAAYPLLAPLAGKDPARIGKLYALEVPKSEQVRITCPLTTGQPLMVEKRFGLGRCLLVATTCDRDWNNLPLSFSYVLLIDQAVRSVAPKREPGAH